MKFYALEQTHGNISVFSPCCKPYLHVFDSKKARDTFISDYNTNNGDPNHRAQLVGCGTVYQAYMCIEDGIRVYSDPLKVIEH